jgi:hypothetical protein
VRDFAVHQTELRSLHAENFGGGGGFALADFGRSERGWFAAVHINQVNAMPLLDESGNGAPHAEFLIVGMRADY